MDLPPSLPALEALEIHSGMVFGPRRTPHLASEPKSDQVLHVRQALEELMAGALAETPCVVAFSGGLDSSAVLAVATDVARRRGLEDPIPLTFRYPQHPRTLETEWQELVIQHLGLREWKIVELHADFDVLGPMARRALLRHGLFWPPNAHTRIPMIEAAKGGALLGGNGGDEVFAAVVKPKKMTPVQIVRMLPPHRALMVGLVKTLPLRWKLLAKYHHGLRFPWLRRSARREVRRRFVETLIGELQGDNYLETVSQSRYLELQQGIAAAFMHDADVHFVEPFFEPRFLHALQADAPPSGFPSRRAAMAHFFGDLLPEALTQRTSKAHFTEAFWGPDSRRFASCWNGAGLDPELIDPEALRRQWLRPKPDLRSATAIQAAWLASGEAG